MVQTIATLIDETLMVMGAHLHVRMTDEEKAYLDAHFELIHIKKGEHLVTRGEEVCYLYYLESGIVRLWFPDKENREISARFIQAKEGADTILDVAKYILAAVLGIALVFVIYSLATNNPHAKEYLLGWIIAVVVIMVAFLII